MTPGLYDNPETLRREMWLLDLQGQPIFFGWCAKNSLPFADKKWEPKKVFGTFPPTR